MRGAPVRAGAGEAVGKLVYVLWGPPGEDEPTFARTLREKVGPRLLELGTRALALHLVDERAAGVRKARITRLDPPPAGFVSFRLDGAEARRPHEALLREATGRLAGYLVEESVPLANTTERGPLGRPEPGIHMVALLERPERLAPEEWMRRWHEEHRVVALETQNTFEYVRNTVVRPLTEDAPPWAGIVDEGFPEDAVLDPMKWYRTGGDPMRLREHVGRMIASCKAFLDLDRVETHPTTLVRLQEE